MKQTKTNLLLARLKHSCVNLSKSHQLPSYLVYLVLKLDKDSDINRIYYLKAKCEHLLRIKGYYKKYPEIENQYNSDIKTELGLD